MKAHSSIKATPGNIGWNVSTLSLVAFLTLALVLAACSKGEASNPVEEATPTPVVTQTAGGQQGGSTSAPTGIAAVDRVIAAVQADDASKLAGQAKFEALACTTAQGLGGPPGCRPGEAAGTVVNVLFTSSCDGHYIRQDELGGLVNRFLEGEGKLAGVYKHNGLLFPSSQYILVYSFATPQGSLARVLCVSDGGIVGVTFGCGTSAREYIESQSLKDPILLPGG